MAGHVFVLHEHLQVGPLERALNQSFDATRAAWWQQLLPAEKEPPAGAQEVLLNIANALHKNPAASVWLWMAPQAADVAAYYFALSQLEKHRGRVFVVQIAGLPFLDEAQKVFFPKSFAGLPAREILKCRRLARLVTPSEWELDLDTWKSLSQSPAGMRVAEGGKKLASRAYDYYDAALLALCSDAYQKAARILQQAVTKSEIQLPEAFLAWRLKEMAAAGQLSLQGEAEKGPRDFELKLLRQNIAETA